MCRNTAFVFRTMTGTGCTDRKVLHPYPANGSGGVHVLQRNLLCTDLPDRRLLPRQGKTQKSHIPLTRLIKISLCSKRSKHDKDSRYPEGTSLFRNRESNSAENLFLFHTLFACFSFDGTTHIEVKQHAAGIKKHGYYTDNPSSFRVKKARVFFLER